MCPPDRNWLEETYRLLDESEETDSEIARGAGLDYFWVRRFRRRDTMADPGVRKVYAIWHYLAERAAA